MTVTASATDDGNGPVRVEYRVGAGDWAHYAAPLSFADDGERVTLVTFADRASHDAWRDHPEHRAAQRRGVDGYYTEYSISVGVTDHAAAFRRA